MAILEQELQYVAVTGVGTPYKIGPDVEQESGTAAVNFVTNQLAVAGDTLFLVLAQRATNTSAISSVSGHGSSNTPEIKSRNDGISRGVSIYRVKLSANIPSGTTLALTLSAITPRKAVFGFCVPGLPDANSQVDDGGSQGVSGTPTSGSLTTSSQCFVLSVFEHDAVASTDSGTPGTGYTEIGDLAGGASNIFSGYAQYKLQGAAGTESGVTYTPTSTANNYVGLMVAWNAVSAVSVTGVVGTGSGSGVVPSLRSTPIPPVGTASAVGVTPVTIADSGTVPVGTGSGSGVVPTLKSTPIPPVGTASGVGVAPVTLASAGTMPVGTASAVGVAPAITSTPIPPVGAASTVGVAPTLKSTPIPPVGTASGVGVAPTLKGGATPSVGTGTAVGIAPTIASTVVLSNAIATHVANIGQTDNISSGSSIAVVTTAPVAAGDLVAVAVGNSNQHLTGVTDNSGLGYTWAVAVENVNGTNNSAVGWAYIIATAGLPSGTTITATFASTGNRKLIAAEVVHGADPVSPISASNTQGSGSTIDPNVALTPADANCVILGATVMNFQGTLAPPSGYTETADFQTSATSTWKTMEVCYREGAPSGSQTLTWTVDTGTRGADESGAIAIKPAVVSVVGTASGVGVTPAGMATVIPPVGSASAVGVVPTLVTVAADVTLNPPVGTASAVGVVPTLKSTVIPSVATATSIGVAPTPSGAVIAPVGVGTAVGVAPAQLGGVTRAQTFEAGTDGSTIPFTSASAGAGEDAWTGGTSGAVYSNSFPHRGSMGAKFTSQVGGKAVSLFWQSLSAGLGDVWLRGYLRLEAVTTSNTSVVRLRDSANTTISILRLNGSGFVVMTDAAGTSRSTGTVQVPAGQMVRVEARVNVGLGQVEWWVYNTADSPTADDHGSASSLSLGSASVDTCEWGWTAAGSAPQTAVSWWLDDLAFSNIAKIGAITDPITDTAPVGTGTAVGVVPSLLVGAVSPVGTASSAGVAPTITSTPIPPVGTGSSIGVAPTLVTVAGDVTLISPVATASATGVAPALTVAAIPPVGIANGAGVAPTLKPTVIAPAGTATAVGVAPTLRSAAIPPVGTASGSGIAPVLIPTKRNNSFEGGTNGAAITTANSGGTSGDPFDVISGPVTPSFTNAGQRGTLGLLLTSAIGGQQQRVAWRNLGAWTSDVWIRGYLKVSALTSEGCVILRVTDTSISQTAALKMTASNKIAAADAGGTNKGSGAVTIGAATARVRIEARFKPGTTAGELEWWLYNTEDSLVEDDHNLVTNQVLGANIDGIDWGWVASNNAPTSAVTWVLDDLAVSTAGKIGPATPVAYPAVGTGTAVGVVPTIKSTVAAPVATGSSVGVTPGLVPPTVAPVGTGSGVGVAPALKATLVAPCGAATGSGVVPSVVPPVPAVVGTGSGSGIAAALVARIVSPVGAGSAVGVAPAVVAQSIVVVPLPATGVVTGVSPTIISKPIAPVGTGSAAGVAPAITTTVPTEVGFGTAEGFAPEIVVVFNTFYWPKERNGALRSALGPSLLTAPPVHSGPTRAVLVRDGILIATVVQSRTSAPIASSGLHPAEVVTAGPLVGDVVNDSMLVGG